MKKQVKVVMLPTEKASKFHKHQELSTGYESMGWFQNLKLTTKDVEMGDHDWYVNTPQHLYFLSDEEIKEGDWFIGDGRTIRQCTLNNAGNINFKGGWYSGSSNCKKIITTTDESLGLPRPSNEFLKKYCELGGIDEVLVEYKCSYEDCNMFGCHEYEGCHLIQQLKVAPDNTITIHPKKIMP